MEFEFIPHTADIQFKAYGSTLEESFSNSAIAATNSICKDKINSKIKKQIQVNGNDLENLLYNFLEELLILFDSEYFVLSKILKIKIDTFKGTNKENFSLEAELMGDLAENYEIYSHIKAVTYNNMFVKQENNKWVCQVVLDV